MSFTALYSSNGLLRVLLKTLVFTLSSFAAIFCASAGYGLLKTLLAAVSDGTSGGFAELATHSGATLGFFVLAAIGAVVAKKCVV